MGRTGNEDGVHCWAVGGHHSRARCNAWRHSEVEVCGQWTWRSGRRQLQQSMRKLQTVPPKYSEDLLLSSKAKQGNAVTIYCATSADAIRSLTSMRHAVRHDSLLFKVHGAFWHYTTAS